MPLNFGQPQEHNRDANWLHSEQERVCTISNMEQTRVTEEDVQGTIKETSNWKKPGRDLIQNFWYKKLTVIHKTFATSRRYTGIFKNRKYLSDPQRQQHLEPIKIQASHLSCNLIQTYNSYYHKQNVQPSTR
jgi:hypothetical protein